jgi:hypothetical protein
LDRDTEIHCHFVVGGCIPFEFVWVSQQENLDLKADVVKVASQSHPVTTIVAPTANDDDAFWWVKFKVLLQNFGEAQRSVFHQHKGR